MKSAEQTTAFTDWHDGKRYLWLLSPAIPVLAVSFLLIYMFIWDWPGLLWGGPLLVYGLIPWPIGSSAPTPTTRLNLPSRNWKTTSIIA